MPTLSALLCLLTATLCAAQGTINVDTYCLEDDPVHQQWYNISQDTGFDKRADQTMNFRVTSAFITIAGYTYSYGADQVKSTIDSCTEYQGSSNISAGQCVKDAMMLASAYGIVGLLGYVPDTACVALLTLVQGLANTLNTNQGQGPNTRSVFDPPYFQYGTNDTSDQVIDLMNNAIDENIFQRNGGNSTATLDKRGCTVRNGNLYTKGHHFSFKNPYGMKLQCKNGCGDTNYDSTDMGNVINSAVVTIYTSNDLNAQFTAYDNRSGRVYARCKFTFEDAPTDTCPEAITGSGCDF